MVKNALVSAQIVKVPKLLSRASLNASGEKNGEEGVVLPEM